MLKIKILNNMKPLKLKVGIVFPKTTVESGYMVEVDGSVLCFEECGSVEDGELRV